MHAYQIICVGMPREPIRFILSGCSLAALAGQGGREAALGPSAGALRGSAQPRAPLRQPLWVALSHG